MVLKVTKSGPLRGSVRVPSDKSLTHRAYLFAALAKSPSQVIGPLRGQDCENTLRILGQLGVGASERQDGVTIVPRGPLSSPREDLDCGNSGTTMRLLAGVLASEPGLQATLVGDASLSRRPMGRVIEPLRRMGAEIEGDTAPLAVHGRTLHGIAYESPVASAQIKSCVLLAGVRAEGRTCVNEPSLSRDHTERMLTALGVRLTSDGPCHVCVEGGQSWDGFEFSVPSDVSSAAFFLCAAAMVPGSQVVLRGVGTNPTRTGVLECLAAAGAKIAVDPQTEQMGEPVADIEVSCADALDAFEVSGSLVPRLIDEIPVLAVLATQCSGVTTFRDAKELRVKESDRIETVATNLRAMGAQVETFEDGLSVSGPTPLTGARVDAEGDHRIGMAFAVAGLIADGETEILNADAIQTSYPRFEDDLRSLIGRTL